MEPLSSLNPANAISAQEDARLDNLKMMSMNKSGKMNEKQMRDIADQFESMIFRQLLKEMRKTVPQEGVIERSHAMDMYMDITDDYLAQTLAENNDLGLEDTICQELKEKQEKSKNRGDIVNEKKKVGSFIDLNPAAKQGLEQDTTFNFIELHPNTDTFIELNHQSKMFDLPKPKDPFIPLGDRKSISTAKLDHTQR